MNAAFYPLLYWNGRSDSLWSQAAAVSESGVSMNGTRLTLLGDPERPRYRTPTTSSSPPTIRRLDPAPYSDDGFPPHGKPGSDAALNDARSCLSTEQPADCSRAYLVNFGKGDRRLRVPTLVSRRRAVRSFRARGPGLDAISPAAKRGARLFVGKASCIDCHNGPLLSDGEFHNIGVPQTGDHVPTVADCSPGTPTAIARRSAKKHLLAVGRLGGLS